MRFVQGQGPYRNWSHYFEALSNMEVGEIQPVLDWCRTNCGPPFGSSNHEWIVEATWDWVYDYPHYRFVFLVELQAMAFKLRWG